MNIINIKNYVSIGVTGIEPALSTSRTLRDSQTSLHPAKKIIQTALENVNKPLYKTHLR